MNQDLQLASALLGASALSGIPIRPDVADQADVPPYVVYAEIALQDGAYTLDGESSLVPARYQFDVYASTRSAANALAQNLTQVLESTFSAVLLNRQSLFEQETRLRRVMLDVSIWFEQDP